VFSRLVPLGTAASVAGAVLIVGIAIGYLFGRSGGTDTRAEREAPGAAIDAPEPETPSSVEPEPEPEPTTETEPEPEPTTETEPEPAASCAVELDVRPDDAIAFAGKTRLGRARGRLELPCGETVLAFEHPRYERATRSIDLAAGEPSSVSLRLERPTFRLRVTSKPSGARVTYGGRSVGTTPLTFPVTGFERTRLRVISPGHRPVSRQIYPKGNRSVSVSLKRAATRSRRGR
jgi:hypothetical protein